MNCMALHHVMMDQICEDRIKIDLVPLLYRRHDANVQIAAEPVRSNHVILALSKRIAGVLYVVQICTGQISLAW